MIINQDISPKEVKMNKFLKSLLAAIFVFTSFASAESYDDFSGTTLDTSLWTESSDSTACIGLDEYNLDTTNQNYHSAQTSVASCSLGGGILLLMNEEFEEGDVLSYDATLQSTSGNIIGRLYIDGNYLDLIVGTDSGGYATSGDIGYWNGESEIGNELGTYDVTVTFNADSADFEVTNPSGSSWAYTASVLTAPYSFGVATRTGDDGIGEIDYDNFEVSSTSATTEITEEVNTTELQERVETLETTVTDLQSQMESLQSDLESQETTITSLQTQVDALESTSNDHETRITSLENVIILIIKRVNKLWKIIKP